ncbi:hypothetical protein V9L05_15945 [Bernardetia sp. Wsw4-3y2]|uniref:hypothetical protein n=1 Tax=Bernardetia sp. Wsw4-3y2 TaxID=3127471 RepID=UPI0030D45660
MFLKDLNFLGGIYRGNTELRFDKPLEEQLIELTQDICQIEYKEKNSIIDVGWFPIDMTITNNSHFKVYVIQNSNWENPITVYSCYDIGNLKNSIQEAINNIQNLT